MRIAYRLKEMGLKTLLALMTLGNFSIKRRKNDLENVRRILLIQFGGIGDMVLLTPSVRAMQATFPAAEITIIAPRESSAQFLLNYQNVTEIRAFDIFSLDMRKIFKTFFWVKLFREVRFVRNKRFDLLCSFRYLPLIDWQLILWILVFFSTAKLKIGVNPAYMGGRSVYHYWLTDKDLQGRHYTDYFRLLLGKAGISPATRATEFPVSAAARKRADALLGAISENEPFVCIHIGGIRLALERELWDIQNYTDIINRLDKKKITSLLLGSIEDSVAAQKLLINGCRCIDLTARTTVEEMAALIARAALFIGNDSGPFHVAVATGTPAIGIFNRVIDEPEYYRYKQDHVFVFRKAVTETPGVDSILKRVEEILKILT